MSLHFDIMRARNAIYDLLMNNQQYFRENMFDSDDDIELEIDEILYTYMTENKINYASQPPKEFDKKLRKYLDIIAK